MLSNSLLAESLYLAQYIERMGTGTSDMIRRCIDGGLPKPDFTATTGFSTMIWRAETSGQIKAELKHR